VITISRFQGETGRASSAVRVGRRLKDRLPGVTHESKSRTKPCMTGKGTCIFSVCYFFAEWKNLDRLLFRQPEGVLTSFRRPHQPHQPPSAMLLQTITRNATESLSEQCATVAVLIIIEIQHSHIAIRPDPASATPTSSTLDSGR
jgi:hypothetical protein